MMLSPSTQIYVTVILVLALFVLGEILIKVRRGRIGRSIYMYYNLLLISIPSLPDNGPSYTGDLSRYYSSLDEYNEIIAQNESLIAEITELMKRVNEYAVNLTNINKVLEEYRINNSYETTQAIKDLLNSI